MTERSSVARSRDGRSARLRALGALDLATVSSLDAEVAELVSEGFRLLVLDLSGLDFINSTGLRCILDLDAYARQDGFSVALVRGPRAVQRVFEVTGTAAHLPFIETDPRAYPHCSFAACLPSSAGMKDSIAATLELLLAPTRMAPSRARAAIARWLAQEYDDDGLEEIALLLVSELVTNCVRHARISGAEPLRLNGVLGAATLRIELLGQRN